MDSLRESEKRSQRLGGFDQGALPRVWRCFSRAAWEHRAFSGGALLSLYRGREGTHHSLRNSSSTVAAAIGGSGDGGKHYGGCGGNTDRGAEAGIAALFASPRSARLGAASAEIDCARYHLWKIKNDPMA